MLLELRSAHHVHDPSRVCMTCHMRDLLTFCMHVAQGRPEVRIVRPESSIKIADVQALLLWVLSEGQNPAWAFVKVSEKFKLKAAPAEQAAAAACRVLIIHDG